MITNKSTKFREPTLPSGWVRMHDYEIDATQRHYEKKIGNFIACVDYFTTDDRIYTSIEDHGGPVAEGKSYNGSDKFSQAFKEAERLAKANQ